MKYCLAFLLSIFSCQIFAQESNILSFDLRSGIIDTIPPVQFDTNKIADQTRYSTGNFNYEPFTLNQSFPFENVYPGSNFTRKIPAAEDLDINRFPLRTSVKLMNMENDTLRDLCSGSMISRKHVLTACHCVAEINKDSIDKDSIYAFPAFDHGQENSKFRKSIAEKVYIFQDWNFNIDIAVIELSDPIGKRTGWLSIGYNSIDSAFNSEIFYKFSYPAKTMLLLDSNEYNGDTLYYSYGGIDLISDDYIGVMSAIGIPGESGSSLIKVRNNNQYTSYGVLSFSSGLKHCKISDWKFYNIKSIVKNDIEKQEEISGITVYPNPFHDKIKVKTLQGEKIQIVSLFDVHGGKISEQKTETSDAIINPGHLAPGIYILRVKTRNQQFVKKIIKI
ncbi:MAG: T9SS type A sorting domain-containing protein [Bacteroidales bacterium]|nr:T9SS type A sorting domain-containing protein [Bacteroidales bacterium]